MTNKISLKTIEQFMEGYTPVYQPLFSLFLARAKSYAQEVGQLTFKKVDTVGDIRPKRILPKDTEMKQIMVGEVSRIFKKFFFANQFILSNFQSKEGAADVTAQVLDEHNKVADELMLFGSGTQNSDVVNNGLFYSLDPNFVEEGTATILADGGGDYLADFHKKVMTSARQANKLAGQKIILFYGEDILEQLDGVYPNTSMPFKSVLADALGANYAIAEMPSDITPDGANGWLVINIDQIQMHYSAIPSVLNQGVNDEKLYAWQNFLLGSWMTEVKALGGLIKQPAELD